MLAVGCGPFGRLLRRGLTGVDAHTVMMGPADLRRSQLRRAVGGEGSGKPGLSLLWSPHRQTVSTVLKNFPVWVRSGGGGTGTAVRPGVLLKSCTGAGFEAPISPLQRLQAGRH